MEIPWRGSTWGVEESIPKGFWQEIIIIFLYFDKDFYEFFLCRTLAIGIVYIYWDLRSLGHLHFICPLFNLSPPILSRLRGFCLLLDFDSPFARRHSFQLMWGLSSLKSLLLLGRDFGSNPFITNHLVLGWLSFIWGRLSPVASFLVVQLNRTSSTKLQKGEKKRGCLAKFPWEEGEWGMPQRSLATFPWGKHMFPRISFLYFYILSLISSLHGIVHNMEGCIMDEILKNLITLPYKNIQKNWIIFF